MEPNLEKPMESKKILYDALHTHFLAVSNINERDEAKMEKNGKIREALTILSSIAFLSEKRPLDNEEEKDWKDKLEEVTMLLG